MIITLVIRTSTGLLLFAIHHAKTDSSNTLKWAMLVIRFYRKGNPKVHSNICRSHAMLHLLCVLCTVIYLHLLSISIYHLLYIMLPFTYYLSIIYYLSTICLFYLLSTIYLSLFILSIIYYLLPINLLPIIYLPSVSIIHLLSFIYILPINLLPIPYHLSLLSIIYLLSTIYLPSIYLYHKIL